VRQQLRRALVLGLLLLPASASAAPTWADGVPKVIAHGGVGLKLGLINTGALTLTGRPTPWDSVAVAGKELDPKAAPSGQVFFDVPLTRAFLLLFSVDIYDLRFHPLSERFIDVAAGFKLAFYKHHQRLAWRPGAAVGLGYLADIGFMRPTTYLTLKAFSELVLLPRGKWAVVLELGFMAVPSGGNSAVDVKIAPSLFLRAGLLY